MNRFTIPLHRLAGIEPVEPGYARSRIAPDLDGFLDHCDAHVDTAYGRLAVRWERAGDAARIEVTVPSGAVADASVPAGWELEESTDAARLGTGRHTLRARRV